MQVGVKTQEKKDCKSSAML